MTDYMGVSGRIGRQGWMTRGPTPTSAAPSFPANLCSFCVLCPECPPLPFTDGPHGSTVPPELLSCLCVVLLCLPPPVRRDLPGGRSRMWVVSSPQTVPSTECTHSGVLAWNVNPLLQIRSAGVRKTVWSAQILPHLWGRLS